MRNVNPIGYCFVLCSASSIRTRTVIDPSGDNHRQTIIFSSEQNGLNTPTYDPNLAIILLRYLV